MFGHDEDLSVLLVKELGVVAIEALGSGGWLAFPAEHAMADAAGEVGRASPATLGGRTVSATVMVLAKHLELLLLLLLLLLLRRVMAVRGWDHSHHVSALRPYRMLLHVRVRRRVHHWVTMVHLLRILLLLLRSCCCTVGHIWHHRRGAALELGRLGRRRGRGSLRLVRMVAMMVVVVVAHVVSSSRVPAALTVTVTVVRVVAGPARRRHTIHAVILHVHFRSASMAKLQHHVLLVLLLLLISKI